MRLSDHLRSVSKELPNDEEMSLLKEIIPQIERLEIRNDRLETRFRNLRIRYNALTKALNIARLVLSEDFCDPFKPQKGVDGEYEI